MPWCTKCKNEFRKGIDYCSDCGGELVDVLLDDKIHSPMGAEKGEKLLITLTDQVFAEMVEALLKDHHVPVIKKHRGSGGYLQLYMGMTNQGVDLYVPASLQEKALELIAPMLDDSAVENLECETEESIESDGIGPESDEFIQLKKHYQKRKQFRVWLILIFLTPGFIWLFLFLLDWITAYIS